MAIRQPDECRCFGGRCWRKFCPMKSDDRRKKVRDVVSKEKRSDNNEPRILSWSSSDQEDAEDDIDDDN